MTEKLKKYRDCLTDTLSSITDVSELYNVFNETQRLLGELAFLRNDIEKEVKDAEMSVLIETRKLRTYSIDYFNLKGIKNVTDRLLDNCIMAEDVWKKHEKGYIEVNKKLSDLTCDLKTCNLIIDALLQRKDILKSLIYHWTMITDKEGCIMQNNKFVEKILKVAGL